MAGSSRNRRSWLEERRILTQVRYDTIFSQDYDVKWGSISPTHRRFVEKLISLTPPGSTILDAACGTGWTRGWVRPFRDSRKRCWRRIPSLSREKKRRAWSHREGL